MSNSSTFSLIVKIAAGGLLLAVLLLILGTTAAVDVTTSILIIGGIVGLFAAVLMGKNIWWLLVFAAPLASDRLPGVPISPIYVAAAIVMPFMGMLAVIGRINLKWSKLCFLDVPVLVFVSVLVASYIRHPVSLGVLGGDSSVVGGSIFPLLFFAALAYISFSFVRTSMEELCKVLGWCVWVVVAYIGFRLILDLSSGGAAVDSVFSDDVRYRSVVGAWKGVLLLMLCRYSLSQLIFSCWRLPVTLICLGAVLLSGERSSLLMCLLSYILILAFRKKILVLLVCGVFSYGSLFVISETGLIKEKFPGSVQRSLAILPGIKIDEAAEKSAQGSTDWRSIVWSMAFENNKSFSYIQNRMWGDGFGVRKKHLREQRIIMQRGGTYGISDREFFALNGVWHCAAIDAIHRIGYVGLGFTVWLMVCVFYVCYRVCRSVVNRSSGYVVFYIFVPIASMLILWGIMPVNLQIIVRDVALAGLAKLIYTTALREKAIEPLWSRHRYVPLMLRESAVPHGELQGANHIAVS